MAKLEQKNNFESRFPYERAHYKRQKMLTSSENLFMKLLKFLKLDIPNCSFGYSNFKCCVKVNQVYHEQRVALLKMYLGLYMH